MRKNILESTLFSSIESCRRAVRLLRSACRTHPSKSKSSNLSSARAYNRRWRQSTRCLCVEVAAGCCNRRLGISIKAQSDTPSSAVSSANPRIKRVVSSTILFPTAPSGTANTLTSALLQGMLARPTSQNPHHWVFPKWTPAKMRFETPGGHSETLVGRMRDPLSKKSFRLVECFPRERMLGVGPVLCDAHARQCISNLFAPNRQTEGKKNFFRCPLWKNAKNFFRLIPSRLVMGWCSRQL